MISIPFLISFPDEDKKLNKGEKHGNQMETGF
jgi:hypothetical protein